MICVRIRIVTVSTTRTSLGSNTTTTCLKGAFFPSSPSPPFFLFLFSSFFVRLLFSSLTLTDRSYQ